METQQKKRSAVEPDEIVAHLRILAAFHKLKLDVQARAPHNPTGLWTAFLGYAVEKFASWISNVLENDGSEESELQEREFPTLDVAMVWHAYILNPLEYHKDCQRRTHGLKRIKAFPVKRLAASIDTLGLEPRFPVPAFGSTNVRTGPQFSVDLVAAVKRQASFIAQVAAVGWTQNPKDIHITVSSAIDKYHCFLKKLWENPEALAVPTLEIDLAWHTHQLKVETYRHDSMMLFGRILQHDDDIPSPELNKAFRRNSYDWKNLFHMDYSSGDICTGFRPVPLATPGTPKGMKRPSSRDSNMNGSEVSLQELYNSVSEKRLSSGADSKASLSPPPSSGSDAAPSTAPSINSLLTTPRPSGRGMSPSNPVYPNQWLRPTNDSTSTISPGYPASGLPDSRMSSTSDLSSIFAYTPPKAKNPNENRGAFDAPRPRTAPQLPSISIGKRPSSAGNGASLRPALKRTRHQFSNSTGNLYVPEMPSPLRRSDVSTETLEEKTESSHSHSKESSSITAPSSIATSTSNRKEPSPFSSCTNLVPSGALSDRTLTSIRQENIHLSSPTATKHVRPSSAGTGAQRSPNNPLSMAPPATSKRPSSSGSSTSKKTATLLPFAPTPHSRRPSSSGSAASKKSTSSSLWFFSRSRPTSPERFDAPIEAPRVEVQTIVSFSSRSPSQPPRRPSTAPQSRSNVRPSTAPQPARKTAPVLTQERPGSSGLFKKKSKSDKQLSGKRSWFRFW